MIWAFSDLYSSSSSYPIGRQRICTHEAAASERDRHGQKLSEKLMALFQPKKKFNVFKFIYFPSLKDKSKDSMYYIYIYTTIYLK